jgi:hypothetical protein
VGIVNPAWLLNHEVEHESHLERRFIMVALSCPVVVDIEHQPLEIWLGPNQTQKYTPDFRVTFCDGDSVIVEVKPEVFVKKHAERLSAAEQQFSAGNQKFLVVTDNHIDANGLSARAMLLMRYGRLQCDDTDAMACQKLVQEMHEGRATVRQLVDQGVSESLIWTLVARHNLRIPAGLSIDASETVSINQTQGGCHDFFCSWFGIAQG